MPRECRNQHNYHKHPSATQCAKLAESMAQRWHTNGPRIHKAYRREQPTNSEQQGMRTSGHRCRNHNKQRPQCRGHTIAHRSVAWAERATPTRRTAPQAFASTHTHKYHKLTGKTPDGSNDADVLASSPTHAVPNAPSDAHGASTATNTDNTRTTTPKAPLRNTCEWAYARARGVQTQLNQAPPESAKMHENEQLVDAKEASACTSARMHARTDIPTHDHDGLLTRHEMHKQGREIVRACGHELCSVSARRMEKRSDTSVLVAGPQAPYHAASEHTCIGSALELATADPVHKRSPLYPYPICPGCAAAHSGSVQWSAIGGGACDEVKLFCLLVCCSLCFSTLR